MSGDGKSNDDPQKKQQQQRAQTRLQSELAHRYNTVTPGRRKRQPGQGSLTEELDEVAQPEVDAEQEQQAAAEGEAPEVVAEPKKSLFELPRKEPSRPSLLGGAVDVSSAPPASGAAAQSPAPAPTPGKSTTRRR